MSIYRPTSIDPETGARRPRTAVYQADFTVRTPDGKTHRIRRSTGQTDRRAARRVVARWKELAALGELGFLGEAGKDGLTLAEACWRYWEETGRHKRASANVAKNLEHLCRLIGGDRLFVDITAADLADAARRRAGEPKNPRKPTGARVALSSVNRQIVEPYRALWRRAKKVWKPAGLGDEMHWGDLLYPEPEERTRTLTEAEFQIFWRDLREDFRPCLEFGANRGLRLSEMIIARDQVDLARGEAIIQIAKKRGGVRSERLRLSGREIALIAAELRRAPSTAVFTYEVQAGAKKGMRLPITYHALKSHLKRYIRRLARDNPGLFENLRPHDLRHDFATRLLRSTGNLEMVRKALRHADIASTRRYAHVTDADVSHAIEGMLPMQKGR